MDPYSLTKSLAYANEPELWKNNYPSKEKRKEIKKTHHAIQNED